jgi:hypothetical protein
MAFEDQLGGALFSRQYEKTFIDKVLAKEDSNKIRELIGKNNLNRSELMLLLNTIVGTEAKLLNYSEWDRYIILKFFVWVREFVKIAELNFDIMDKIHDKKNTCGACKKHIKTKDTSFKCACINPVPLWYKSEVLNSLINTNTQLIEHNVKFLIDLYLNISRTSLSLGASGFQELVRNKFEISYPEATTHNTEAKGGLLGLFKGR